MNSFQEAIQIVLNADADNLNNKVRDYLSEENIYSLETYTAFLDDLPCEQYLPTAETLIDFVISYSDFSIQNWSYTMQQQSKKIKAAKDAYKFIKGKPIENKKTPSLEIKDDIKALEQAKEVLMKNFNAAMTMDKPMLINPPTNLKETFAFLDLMIKDLKTKNFEIAKKYVYYEHPPKSKTPLKHYLDELTNKYNLKFVTIHKKQLIDSIQ